MSIENVLSLFDGMSGGRIALDNLSILPKNFYSSEINKQSMAIAKKNYPDIIHLGDVTKWDTWDLPRIDLLMGGSPCQGFSKAGKLLNFDDERSKLFFEYVNCLKHFRPKYFFLENVEMSKECENIISSILGVNPVHLNSSLLSAQSRPRVYWTNMVNPLLYERPKEHGIVFKDIMEHNTDPKYFMLNGDISKTGQRAVGVKIGDRLDYYNRIDKTERMISQNRIGQVMEANDFMLNKFWQTSRVFSIWGKTPCLTTTTSHNRGPFYLVDEEKFIEDNKKFRECIRTPTILEAERLQTLPENYTDVEGVSLTARYFAVGNGWTIKIIESFFKYLT